MQRWPSLCTKFPASMCYCSSIWIRKNLCKNSAQDVLSMKQTTLSTIFTFMDISCSGSTSWEKRAKSNKVGFFFFKQVSGQAKLILNNGNDFTYIGEVDEDNKPCGQGVAKADSMKNEYTLQGTFLNSLPHGFCKLDFFKNFNDTFLRYWDN